MPLAQQLAGGLILIGVLTVMFLPGRQTVAGINAGFNGLQGLFATVMGTKG
jgi:hypothetical protein